MSVHKKNAHARINSINTLSYLFLDIFLVNIFSLYIHNNLLPWLYFLLFGIYYLLNCDISKKDRINYFSGLNKIFFKPKYFPVFFLHWILFVLAPALVSLYYFDFKLLLVTILINTCLVLGIVVVNPFKK